MRNITKTKRQQNQGFSLFTVLITVSFVGILGLLVLYIALANFNMKVTDLKGKDSFYTAERALEEIRTGLQEDVGNAMSKAYTQVLETYNKENRSQDSSMDRQRQSDFQDRFIKELMRTLRASQTTDDIYSLDYLRGYVDLEYDDSKESLIITNPTGTSPVMKAVKNVGKNTEDNGVLLKNLKVIYVDEKGHAAIICTDIRLLVPEVQFPTPSTLPDLMNMIVVADKGIICEGNESTPTSINGSIYAGNLPAAATSDPDTSIQVTSGASLNVESGDKVVCKGEISVGLNSTFTSGGSVNLWARGLNAASVKNVTLSGTTYFADDLTIAGKNNNVKISGNYYGYGSYESATSDLSQYLDVSGDLAERIINCRNEISGFTQAASLLKTKELTQTRIQRALLHSILQILEAPLSVPYSLLQYWKASHHRSQAPDVPAQKSHQTLPYVPVEPVHNLHRSG